VKAIFLDRDGTVIVEKGYVTTPDDVELLPGAAEAIRGFKAAGWAVFVVTNQGCVAKGMITEDELADIHLRMMTMLGAEGALIDGIYCCPHHPEGSVSDYAIDCDCRKPKPGLLEKAASEHGLDLSISVMVGDTRRDLEAGRAAGVKLTVLVLTGKGADTLQDGVKAQLVANDLPAVLRSLNC
jgi:D-glycero-D-manno-heptose 1,7-bisphosphate phosphatase